MALLRPESVQPFLCTCAEPLARRRFLGLTLATIAAGAAPLDLANAASGHYKAMLVTCIDPRYVTTARNYMVETRHWNNDYSQFSFAGAAVGVVADRFKTWHDTFWDNLGITIQLHNIQNLVVLDHRDCGAAELAYGKEAVATPKVETETHRKALAQFRAEVAQRAASAQPQWKLNVITGLISKDGKKVEMLG
jgi:carbonic anhydrase